MKTFYVTKFLENIHILQYGNLKKKQPHKNAIMQA
jgi:hypothetical protein